jgi:ribonuclease HI
MTGLCASYLMSTEPGSGATDAVARFHLANGARLERLNWLGDTSAPGVQRSFGLTVNYVYRLADVERNHEAYANQYRVAASRRFEQLARSSRPQGSGSRGRAARARYRGEPRLDRCALDAPTIDPGRPLTMTHVASIVFTDGAAKGNPGPGGWGVIVITPDQRVTELGGGSPYTTNNKMELSGAIAALEHLAARPGPVVVYTDSTYLIQGITQWVRGWRARGWKTSQGTDVLNRDLWERLSGLVAARPRGDVDWRWVRGHVGTPGNERADAIAVAFSLGQPAHLYDGPLDGYSQPVLPLPPETPVPKRPAASGPGVRGKAAHSYVSVVDGVPMRHRTWAECEARVKGRPGARFRKAASQADESLILRGWGIDPNRL